MMRIILVRHGKPDTPNAAALRARDFTDWIDRYNSAHLCSDSKPTAEIIDRARNCNAVVCSHLSRSLESASALGLTQITYSDKLFREMEMPSWHFPSPHLAPQIWAVLFRVFWFLGFSSNAESFQQAKARALEAAEKLLTLAQTHRSVVFIGHGLLNRYIAKALLAHSWQGPTNPGKDYWKYGVYESR